MNHEFRQYRLARIEGYNITHASLESRFHRGIADLSEFEKAIAEQVAAAPTTVVAWRQSELEQQGCREGIRLAALEFYWDRRHEIRLDILGEKQGEVSSVPSAPDFL